MIYRIQCWRALDGTLFVDEKEALVYQKRLDTEQRIRIFCKNLIDSSLSIMSLEAQMIAHMDELFDL